MAKVVMIPKGKAMESSCPSVGSSCSYEFEEGELRFHCQGCEEEGKAPSMKCLIKIRNAMRSHVDVRGVVFEGEQHIWIRERGLESVRSLIEGERSWDQFVSTMRSLPCVRPIPSDRISRYIEGAKGGRREMFCNGNGPDCRKCIRTQQGALDSLRSDRRRIRKAVATDRFRITDVKGGSP